MMMVRAIVDRYTVTSTEKKKTRKKTFVKIVTNDDSTDLCTLNWMTS